MQPARADVCYHFTLPASAATTGECRGALDVVAGVRGR